MEILPVQDRDMDRETVNTDQLVDDLSRLNDARTTEFAEKGYNALRDIFSNLPERWEGARLSQLHEKNRPAILRLLQQDQGLSQSSQHLHFLLARLISGPSDLQDPSILTDISVLLSYLLYKYVDAFVGQDRESIEDALTVALAVIAHELVVACLPQIERLGQLVFTILQEPSVVAKARRLILVELPIGNSIATHVLRHFLEKHECAVEVVRISLSRSDKAWRGTTRKQLLKARLEESLRDGDLVILVDEWVTGSNFQTVSEYIGGIVSRTHNALFLPVGMLAIRSPLYKESISCIRTHKKLIQRFGFGSEKSSRFRIEFPPLKVLFPRPTYFFWSEHDRLSGYRKIRLLKKVFDIVDSSVKRLMKSRESWPEATVMLLMHMATRIRAGLGDTTLPIEVVKHPANFLKYIETCHSDYEQVRNQLQAIEHPSNLGQAADPVQAILEIGALFMEQFKDRPAVICVGLGLALIRDDVDITSPEDDIDEDSQKTFEQHAPLATELEPPQNFFHDRLMREIIAAIEA